MASRRITQKDIAAELGLHRSTVSLSLRNSPNIPEETRAKVLAMAESLGYQPDPMLSALAAYREIKRPACYGGTVAWLYSSEGNYDWRTVPVYQQYFDGVQEQGKKRGYRIEMFDVKQRGMTPKRLAGILKARNIQGVLVCPLPEGVSRMDFLWEDFSVVTFGYTLQAPNLHRVTATQFRGVAQIMTRLHGFGYRRIGYAIREGVSFRTGNNYLAAYLTSEYLQGSLGSIPPLTMNHRYTPEALLGWISDHKIDAVITWHAQTAEILRQNEIRIPEDIGLASCSLDSLDSEISGLYENPVEVGKTALDFLVAMMHRGERGIPPYPHHLLVEGTWVQGQTVRQQD